MLPADNQKWRHELTEELKGYLESGDDGQDDEPEPEKDVDFFIDNIQRKDAETVEALNCSRWTEFVKCTFCDFGKHS